MKKYSILALALMVLCTGTTAEARYSGGTGEPNDPYRIATAADLNDIGNYEEDWDKHFILVNDVNLAEYTGTQFNIIGRWINRNDPKNNPFTGIFDGNDHKIFNFTWNSTGRSGIGIVGYLGIGGEIKNLGMENIDVNAVNGAWVAGLAGFNWGTITDCYSTGNVSGGGSVGGIVGENDGKITNSYVIDIASGYVLVGGLVGDNYQGTITNCYSTNSVSGLHYIGGLVGNNHYGTISDCYSTGSVSGNDNVGGLVGRNSEPINYCYSTAIVLADADVGGLVGGNGGAITNCYSTGSVSGNRNAGGLVGDNTGIISYGKIINCYSTVVVDGNVQVGGLVGSGVAERVASSFWDIETSDCNTSAGGTPKTTAEMKTKSTFTNAGWDFVEIWGIGEHQTYPYLLTGPAGDFNYDKKVDLLDLAILASHWLEEK